MPSSSTTPVGDQYSPLTGLTYIFNLIVGTGCLTLPAAFGSAGYVLSACMILVLALVSYMTVTWVVESMACANAICHHRRMKQLKKRGQVSDELVNRTLENAEAETRSTDTSEDHDGDEEEQPLITDSTPRRDSNVEMNSQRSPWNSPSYKRNSKKNEKDGVIERTVGEYYAIQERLEMGQMAKLFYSKGWVTVFYIILCLYLYGDLAIYEAAVAKSLRDITCNYAPDNCTQALSDGDRCFQEGSDISRFDMYRIYTCIFVGVMGPFVFFNLTKTKYMQMMTTVTRWLALITMITWAVVLISQGKGQGHPPTANPMKVPELFGVCVYSFMCHHSLPSLITPINEKKSILKLLAADYLLILLFYYLLAFTGVFAFDHLEDLYTLNFLPDRCDDSKSNVLVTCLQMFLLLFPVFTLSTNFPIIAITLRNNLKGLFLRETRRYSFFTSRCLFPLLAIIPPTLIAVITSNVEFLVGITGAYAGSMIQYVVPATLVYYARKSCLQHIGMGVKNPHAAPLQHNLFLVVICVWAAVCQIFVSIYLFGPSAEN